MRALIAVAIALLSGCASLGQWDKQKLLAPVQSIPDQTPMLIQEYNRALARAQAHPRSEVAIRDYTEASIALVDTSCLQWLDRVSLAAQQSRLGASTLDVTSGLATTVMGLANASSAVVGSVGAGFAALAGYGHAIDTTVLMAPSQYAAQQRLMEIMASAAQEIRSDPGATWVQAYGRVQRYARYCNYGTISQAVNDSLLTTTTHVTPTGAMKTVPR